MITCDSFFHELRADGIGAEAHATECLSAEDEEKLWAISADTLQGLMLNALFFYNGKNFILRVDLNIAH